jgi:starch phosphorylase
MYANAVADVHSVRAMTRVRAAPDPSSPDIYGISLSSSRPIGDYTARVLPAHPNVSTPLECARIEWQR